MSNTGTTPQDVFILIDGYFTAEFGSFDLTTSTVMLPPSVYTKTVIPQACQLMTGATALLSSTTTPAIGDDAVSATTALPFALSYFGAPVTHFAASANGNLQFFSSAAGVGDNDYSNVLIPTAAVPNGFAAPFWDDLTFVGTSSVQASTTGTAPNRKLTVEWFDWTFIPSSRPERLQFQVQLYEAGNVIEFHYCNLAQGTGGDLPRTTGSSATIGLENQTGTAGVLHSYNQGSSVSTTSALRFTP